VQEDTEAQATTRIITHHPCRLAWGVLAFTVTTANNVCSEVSSSRVRHVKLHAFALIFMKVKEIPACDGWGESGWVDEWVVLVVVWWQACTGRLPSTQTHRLP
jgi:hypothetical protein